MELVNALWSYYVKLGESSDHRHIYLDRLNTSTGCHSIH